MVLSTHVRHPQSVYQVLENRIHVIVILLLIATILLKIICVGPDNFLVHVVFLTFLVSISIITYYVAHRPRDVYLVNYACFRPDSSWRASKDNYLEHARLVPFYDANNFQFIKRMLQRSGLGNETCVPPSLHYIPPLQGLSTYRDETELIICKVIDDLVRKTCINPNAIDLLIVNCSLFNPTPSLSDMIMRRYKLRDDIRNIQLSGMGCSAGLIAVGLARNFLQTASGSACALLVSTEILTQYKGKKRSMQLPNLLFRTGGAAMLLSTCKAKARFKLIHMVRQITSDNDNAYRCAFQEEDEEGNSGINLSKDLLPVAAQILKDNITILGPLVLPVSEKVKFLLSFPLRMVLNGRINIYVPDFTTAFHHFCIHAGGPAVIDGVQKGLGLLGEHVEPSRMTLHRFGNTSSTSLWYQLAYMDAKGSIKKDDIVCMIGFGSGYKCISSVWKCMEPTRHADIAWADCIHRYPLNPY